MMPQTEEKFFCRCDFKDFDIKSFIVKFSHIFKIMYSQEKRT